LPATAEARRSQTTRGLQRARSRNAQSVLGRSEAGPEATAREALRNYRSRCWPAAGLTRRHHPVEPRLARAEQLLGNSERAWNDVGAGLELRERGSPLSDIVETVGAVMERQLTSEIGRLRSAEHPSRAGRCRRYPPSSAGRLRCSRAAH